MQESYGAMTVKCLPSQNKSSTKIRTDMNAKEFYDTVKAMREAQKEWFKTKNRVAIVRSKVLEKKIDQEIERVEALMNPQPNENQLKLFDNEQQTEER